MADIDQAPRNTHSPSRRRALEVARRRRRRPGGRAGAVRRRHRGVPADDARRRRSSPEGADAGRIRGRRRAQPTRSSRRTPVAGGARRPRRRLHRPAPERIAGRDADRLARRSGRVDALAQARFKAPLARLTPAQRIEIVDRHRQERSVAADPAETFFVTDEGLRPSAATTRRRSASTRICATRATSSWPSSSAARPRTARTAPKTAARTRRARMQHDADPDHVLDHAEQHATRRAARPRRSRRAPQQWDVIVVGSGAAGGMAAFQLATAGVKVLLLEAGRCSIRRKEYRTMEWPYASAEPRPPAGRRARARRRRIQHARPAVRRRRRRWPPTRR